MRERPAYLRPETSSCMRRRRARSRDAVRRALDGVDAVFHLAAAVGVGQSMYEIDALHVDEQPRHGGAAARR